VNAPPAGRELREPQRLLALFVSLLYLLLALRAAKDLKESDAFKAAVVALLTSENLLLLEVTLLTGAVEEYDELSEKQQAELAEKECWKAGNLAAWRAAKKRN
jgi:hypothetical protein